MAISPFIVCAQGQPRNNREKTIGQKVDSVLKLMTLDEKIGQMNQYNGDWDATGPITKDGDKQDQVRKGRLGSMLNVTGVEHTRELQEIAMESRLKIPLLFGQDWNDEAWAVDDVEVSVTPTGLATAAWGANLTGQLGLGTVSGGLSTPAIVFTTPSPFSPSGRMVS